MTRRIIDISMPLESEVISDPRPYRPEITCFDRHQSCEPVAPFFPDLEKEDLPGGKAWAVCMVQLLRGGMGPGIFLGGRGDVARLGCAGQSPFAPPETTPCTYSG